MPPLEWLASLPVFDVESPIQGYSIYTGAVYGVTNLAVNINSSQVHILSEGSKLVRFNDTTGNFEDVVMSQPGIAGIIASESGLTEAGYAGGSAEPIGFFDRSSFKTKLLKV